MDSQRVNPANTPDRQLLPKIDKELKNYTSIKQITLSHTEVWN